jgi:hypothetical protein
MLLTPHAVVGATIGALVPNPVLSVQLALGSHFLLDTVPHWQETLPPYTPHRGTWVRIPIDAGLSVSLVEYIARSRRSAGAAVWITAGTAMAPDLDSVLYAIPRLVEGESALTRYLRWHVSIQRETASLLGLLPQILVILSCLIAVRRRR